MSTVAVPAALAAVLVAETVLANPLDVAEAEALFAGLAAIEAKDTGGRWAVLGIWRRVVVDVVGEGRGGG